jgi:hypothetical protein
LARTHLWCKDVVPSPLLDVRFLAVVPSAVPEGIGPSILVKVGYIVGQEEEIWVHGCLLDARNGRWARGAALGLEESAVGLSVSE